MEEKRKLGTGLQVWLWIIFVLNIITALGALAAVVGSAALGVGPVYTVLCVVSFLLEIVLIAGIAMLLFKSKKVGFNMICGLFCILATREKEIKQTDELWRKNMGTASLIFGAASLLVGLCTCGLYI